MQEGLLKMADDTNQPIQLDDNFLTSLGLGAMSDEDKKAFLQHLYEELELRVGTELSKNLTDSQLEDFEKLINANDQQGAMQWLEANCPNYKDVVKVEIEKLRQEISQNKDVILSGGDVDELPQAA